MNSLNQKSTITIGQMIVIKIPKEVIEKIYLSAPGWNHLNGSKGYVRDRVRSCNKPDTDEKNIDLKAYRDYDEKKCVFTYEDHINGLLKEYKLSETDYWLIIGARNLGNNLRIVGYREGEGLLQLFGEQADTNPHVEYTCLCMKENGSFSIERIKFSGGKPNQEGIIWAVSGQELVWDGKAVQSDEEVFEKILPYTYDMRNIWRTKGSSRIEQNPSWIPDMADCFVENLGRSPEELAKKLLEKKKEISEQKNIELERESRYLHSAIGISKEGDIIIVQRHGKIEDIAKTLKDAGAERAIELDQGGSCGVMIGKNDQPESIRIIFSSHYFRPRATALLVFKFNESAIDDKNKNIIMIEDSNLLKIH